MTDKNIQKYELTQDGRIYILSSEIYKDSIRLTCVEVNRHDPPVFLGLYTLYQLQMLSQIFSSSSTIREAQEIINKTIESQKVRIENKGNQINVLLFLLNQGQNPVFILKPKIEVTYSPPRYLPTRKVFLPPVYTQYPTVQIHEENTNTSYSPYITKSPKVDKLTLPLTPRRQIKTVVQQSPQVIGSPKREQIDIITGTSPSKTQMHYSAVSSSQRNKLNNLYQPNISNNQYISSNYKCQQKLYELQNEMNKVKNENEILKNNTSKLINDINILKNQIIILNQEKEKLRQNKGIIPNQNELNEITILKQENERLNNELLNIKNDNNNELENYKKIKENEISFLKSQIEDLYQQLNNIQQENDNLKSQIKLINKNNISQSQSSEQNLSIVKGEIIEDNSELEFLTRKICHDYKKISLYLLYKASVDTDKAEAFHRKCDNAKSSIVLIKTKNGKRFGGYTSCDWGGQSIEKKDDNAFVFSFDKMEIYDIIPGENAIGCYPAYGPIFLGCQIRIYDDAFTKGGTTFQKNLNYKTNEDYELTGGLQKFQIKEIEVYGVELEL